MRLYMRQMVIIWIFFVMIIPPAQADTGYTLRPVRDSVISTLGLGIATGGFFYHGSANTQMPKADLIKLDSVCILPRNNTLDTGGTILASSALLLPGITVLTIEKNLNTWTTYAVMYLQAFSLTAGTKNMLKAAISRWRPYTYIEGFSAKTAEANGNYEYYDSFPSGHTSYAFLGASFFTASFWHEHQQSTWRIPVAVSAYTAATAVGVLRVASGEHFISDVATGAAIGTLFGFLVPFIHRQQTENTAISTGQNTQIVPLRNGISFTILY